MSNTTDLTDAEATPAARLIIKAVLARRTAETGTVREGREAVARIMAYGGVAADVLDMAQTPFAFVEAIRCAYADLPHPAVTGLRRDRAVTAREAWQRQIVANVTARLGQNDVTKPPA